MPPTTYNRRQCAPYATASDGERLFFSLQQHVNVAALSDTLEISDGDDWVEFTRESITDNLLRRLIIGAKGIQKHCQDPITFRHELRRLIQKVLPVNREQLAELMHYTEACIQASHRDIQKADADKLFEWAKRHHRQCYLCGIHLDFKSKDYQDSYTADHIWPQMLGGNSELSNLLPACFRCNTGPKGNLSTWGSVNVQAYVLGVAPSENKMKRTEGQLRFALQRRKAMATAALKNTSLKDAYICVGPIIDFITAPYPVVNHFFNISWK